jgi:hypothetical protein
MTRRILGLVLATTLLAACDNAQPPIGCPVQSLEWAATYKPLGTNTCAVKAGEQLGIQKFSRPSGDERLIIKPETLATLETNEEVNVGYLQGVLAKEADAEGFCSATDVVVIGKSSAEPGQQPVDITYAWSNVRMSATPLAPGTQMVANLEYTEAGCTAQYEVWAMWPAVGCESEEEGKEGQPDNSICANAGSINPDFATVCDPDALLCVPARRPPSLK